MALHGCGLSGYLVSIAALGGGHTWPGGNQYLPERIIGKTSMDIDASEIIWDYFAKRPMK